MAMFHPSLTLPTTFATGTATSEKDLLDSESPVICFNGEH